MKKKELKPTTPKHIITITSIALGIIAIIIVVTILLSTKHYELNSEVITNNLTESNFQVQAYTDSYLNKYNKELNDLGLEVTIEQMIVGTSIVGNARISLLQFENNGQSKLYESYISKIEATQGNVFEVKNNILIYSTSEFLIGFITSLQIYK